MLQRTGGLRKILLSPIKNGHAVVCVCAAPGGAGDPAGPGAGGAGPAQHHAGAGEAGPGVGHEDRPERGGTHHRGRAAGRRPSQVARGQTLAARTSGVSK